MWPSALLSSFSHKTLISLTHKVEQILYQKQDHGRKHDHAPPGLDDTLQYIICPSSCPLNLFHMLDLRVEVEIRLD